MTQPEILGQLSDLQERMAELLQGLPETQANARFEAHLACLSWYLGRSVYRELHWLREVLAEDRDLAGRVRALFARDHWEDQCPRLPPPDHLLRWAAEIQSEHLYRLATPGALPPSSLLENDRLAWFLLQETARDYEAMLAVLHARRLQQPPAGFRVSAPLSPRQPVAETLEVTQGHYRIGSRDQPFAYDHELPPQAVELSSYRIARHPVTNAEYLAFLTAGGYAPNAPGWDPAGRAWQAATGARAPWHWRQDAAGQWYEMGLNGPVELSPAEPVAGLSHHEARAYAAWVASLGGACQGAVIQHEYQWEVAARSGWLEGVGKVWEWCANPFHPYPDFQPFPEAHVSQNGFDGRQISLRGASLHTPRCLRRASYRSFAPPDHRHQRAGVRLVFPASPPA